MKLTTRAHYSVKALLDLSLQPDDRPASVRSIAQRQGISPAYLEKLLITLRQAGIVASARGPQGGYYLARPTADISLGQVLAAVGERIEPLLPEGAADDARVTDWVTYGLWRQLHAKLQDALYSISLADLYYDARSWQASQGEEASFVI